MLHQHLPVSRLLCSGGLERLAAALPRPATSCSCGGSVYRSRTGSSWRIPARARGATPSSSSSAGRDPSRDADTGVTKPKKAVRRRPATSHDREEADPSTTHSTSSSTTTSGKTRISKRSHVLPAAESSTPGTHMASQNPSIPAPPALTAAAAEASCSSAGSPNLQSGEPAYAVHTAAEAVHPAAPSLSSEQLAVLEADHQQHRVLIAVAGSGKTEVLVQAALKAFAAGKNVLLLTKVSSVTVEITNRLQAYNPQVCAGVCGSCIAEDAGHLYHTSTQLAK